MYHDSLATVLGKANSSAALAAHLFGLRPKQVAGMLPGNENRERGPPC